jgi:hypothetical protein
MAELQNTLFGDGPVPTRAHPNDIVECSDGTVCAIRDALVDCRGGFHSDDEDRHEANVAIVSDILKGVEEWSDEYHTGNVDYPDCYAYIVEEVSHDWPERIKEWVESNYGDYYGHTDYDDVMDELVSHVVEGIDGDYESEYNGNEYACYSGSGCCLYSLDIGECEERIDIAGHDELMALHESGELDDVLDDLERDFCIGRSRRREKNEETGYYEPVGRRTYMPYEHHAECPTFEIYTMPGGQWRFVVPAERMEELFHEAVAVLNGCEEE